MQVWNAADDSEEPLVHMQVDGVDGKTVGLNKCRWMNSGLCVVVTNPDRHVSNFFIQALNCA